MNRRRNKVRLHPELLSKLVFESCRSCGDLASFGGFDPVFERDAAYLSGAVRVRLNGTV